MNRTLDVVLELYDVFGTLFAAYFKQENILPALNLVPSYLRQNKM